MGGSFPTGTNIAAGTTESQAGGLSDLSVAYSVGGWIARCRCGGARPRGRSHERESFSTAAVRRSGWPAQDCPRGSSSSSGSSASWPRGRRGGAPSSGGSSSGRGRAGGGGRGRCHSSAGGLARHRAGRGCARRRAARGCARHRGAGSVRAAPRGAARAALRRLPHDGRPRRGPRALRRLPPRGSRAAATEGAGAFGCAEAPTRGGYRPWRGGGQQLRVR
mmetsp:Transcript_105003/g.214079  ORF Transcript_105003/g.214079 Transcript_105003/m.214079 type:complete len:220 (+) Transcript_105003:612-1271(+)